MRKVEYQLRGQKELETAIYLYGELHCLKNIESNCLYRFRRASAVRTSILHHVSPRACGEGKTGFRGVEPTFTLVLAATSASALVR